MNSGPFYFLLTCVYFNPDMEKYLHPLKVRDEITYPFPSSSGEAVEDWELI